MKKRNWQYSGYKECHECVKVGREMTRHYDTWTSTRPSVLVLCADCYEWIYVHNRKQPTLLDLMENENKKGGEIVKKYKFLTGTGDGNHIIVTEKLTYTWLEFSNEDDCRHFLKGQPKAEFKGAKSVTGRPKVYQVIIRKS